MIKVKYNRYLNRLTMDGHAGSAPIGHDLVCSAASILAHTLAANVEHMADAGMCLDVVQDIQEGKARISCKAVRGSERIVANTFQNVCVGFEILASKFPENISFKIMG